jgi:hypothetical protein
VALAVDRTKSNSVDHGEAGSGQDRDADVVAALAALNAPRSLFMLGEAHARRHSLVVAPGQVGAFALFEGK